MNMPAHLRAPDFLHKYAETPLSEQYIAAGSLCRLETNSEAVLEAATRSFLRNGDRHTLTANGFSLRVWVDESDGAQGPWPKPYVRGLDHLVFAGFDSKSSFLADLSTRRVIGRVSLAMAQDIRYWRMTIFPMLMTIVSGSVGLLELHAACIARGEDGVLLLGTGRSGKSTLAMAMSYAGHRVLSDDRVFCSLGEGAIRAYGLPRPVKIREDAAKWFEQLRSKKAVDVQNGEAVFYSEVDGAESQPNREPCEPRALIFLERHADEACRITRMRRSETRTRIEGELLAEAPDAQERQEQVMEKLLEIPAWQLRYGTDPHRVAEHLGRFLPGTAQ